VATADVEFVGRSAARASLHIESGHLPAGIRTRLVDALLDTPEVSSCKHLLVALPLGDTEILDRIHQRCDPADVRPAGATCLVEADLAGGMDAEPTSYPGDEPSSDPLGPRESPAEG
jgi:hypothetical protein